MKTELYTSSLQRLPDTGKVILGYQSQDMVVVYQAYKNSIADYAVANQVLGGAAFSYKRMSWIKPNFLWMMYRCGWADKPDQERVLALWINKSDFELILSQAAMASFDQATHHNYDDWKKELETKEVRLQWDPDHDPYGNKMQRRAIQIGLKGETLAHFGKNQIKRIDDITGFVKEQKQLLDNGELDSLMLPFETVYELANKQIGKNIGIG